MAPPGGDAGEEVGGEAEEGDEKAACLGGGAYGKEEEHEEAGENGDATDELNAFPEFGGFFDGLDSVAALDIHDSRRRCRASWLGRLRFHGWVGL